MWETALTVLSLLLRLIGLAGRAEKLLAAHEAKKQAQEKADAPITKQEVADWWDH